MPGCRAGKPHPAMKLGIHSYLFTAGWSIRPPKAYRLRPGATASKSPSATT